MSRRRACCVAIWVAFCVVASSIPGAATTLVYDNDQELARQSEAVLVGRVVSVTPEYVSDVHGVQTKVRLAVDATVAGKAQGKVVEVVERGGQLPGLEEKVFGVPEYRVGERVLLFVQRDRKRNLRTTALALGKYRVEATSSGNWVARREFHGAAVLHPRSRQFDADPRPTERPLADVIAEAQAVFAARGEPTSELTLPAPGDDGEVEFSAPFSLLGQSRWFAADSGLPVAFWVDQRGLAALGPAASETAIANAMAAWNNVPGSMLRLEPSGSIEPQRFDGCNGPNRIVFDDPYGEISNPTNCSGVLALGGYCAGTATMVRNGTRFSEITVGKIVFADGWDACGVWTQCNIEEVATHELGHTIGLGHSADRTATMAAVAHFDGRCAALTSDDVSGAAFLYGTEVPDVVLLPRAPVSLRLRAGTTFTAREFPLQVRNADQYAWSSTPVRIVVRDGTCPSGTVVGVDTDPATPGLQDTLLLGAKQTVAARVRVEVSADAVETPTSGSVYRCTLAAEAVVLTEQGLDRNTANNSSAIVLDVRDDNDSAAAQRGQIIRDTVLDSLSPVRIVLPKTMPVQTRAVRFRLRNVDQGTTATRDVAVDVDLGDCPAGTVESWDLVAKNVGDQHSVVLGPGQLVTGTLVLAPPNAGFFTPSRRSPARCTLWIRASSIDGEANLTNNATPLVLDVIDGLDF